MGEGRWGLSRSRLLVVGVEIVEGYCVVGQSSPGKSPDDDAGRFKRRRAHVVCQIRRLILLASRELVEVARRSP